MTRPELERPACPWPPYMLGELLPQPWGIVWMDQIERAPSDYVLKVVAEYTLHGGAGIKPRAVGCEDGDHV